MGTTATRPPLQMRQLGMRKPLGWIYWIAVLAVVALPSESAVAARFSVTKDPKQTCSAIEFEGEIRAGDYDKFGKVLREAKQLAPLRRLYLNSSGGNLATALALTEFIRNTEPNLETIVRPHQMCNSACVIILTVGKRDLVSTDSQLIIHQAFNQKTGTETAEFTRKIGQYLALNGLPPDVMWTMENLKPGEQLAITSSNAKRLGFTNFTFYGGTNSPATPNCSWDGWILGSP